jgi:hypothetical protein
MTLPVVVAALIFWAAVFMIYFTSTGTTPTDFFLGRYELPPDLGAWKETGVDATGGLLREERVLLPDGHPHASYVLKQVRFRDLHTRAIVRTEPEQRLARRRLGRGNGE